MKSEPDASNEFDDPTAMLFDSFWHAGYQAQRPATGALVPQPHTAETDPGQLFLLKHQQNKGSPPLPVADAQQLNQKLLALLEFQRGLENTPDQELAAQSMAKTLQAIYQGGLVGIFQYLPQEQRYKLLASAGKRAGLLMVSEPLDVSHKAVRLAASGKTPVRSQDLAQCEPFTLDGHAFPALLAAPMVRQNTLRGLILVASEDVQAFSPGDCIVLEAAAVQLANIWEYAHQNEILTDFAQAISTLSIVQETGSLLEMIATVARRTLQASLTIVASFNQQEWMMRSAGKAPLLIHSLHNGAAGFMEEAMKSPFTFRLQDLRNERRAVSIELDSPDLCSLLATPIRINGTTSGLLLAFGKINAEGFADRDVFLAEMLAAHAGMNLESCYLNQELRDSLKTTQLLHDLSQQIAQAEDLTTAARIIARTAFRLMQARYCGLILFSAEGRKEAEVLIPTDDPAVAHPYPLIQQAMESRQTIYLAESETGSRVAMPIQTPRRCYGALWLELSEEAEGAHYPKEEIRILVNQAAVALERSILLEETRYQARELVQAYLRLDQSYDQTLRALMRTLDARDRETEGHSERVTSLSLHLGQELGLSKNELKALWRGALLHDIGKIGICDEILLKKGPLTCEEWEVMRRHPQIGADIIQAIPALHDALPVIAFHQERWDGSGYPLRLSGKEIPLLARIFAVVDVYDALTCDRPYRKGSLTSEEAIEYLQQQAGSLFDPEVVYRFAQMIRAGLPAGSPEVPAVPPAD